MSKKLDPDGYATDKPPHYWLQYEAHFAPLTGAPIRLLELGVKKGGSLLLWRDYFPQGVIAGLDVDPVQLANPGDRVHCYRGFQQDTALLDRIAHEVAPQGFDVIIDDASHLGDLTRISFWHLFDHHLKPGGMYVIEDWGTGYWDIWPDGRRYKPRRRLSTLIEKLLRRLAAGRGSARLRSRLTKAVLLVQKRVSLLRSPSHNHGMVGFIKELVDECGWGDITHPDYGLAPHRPSKFQRLELFPGQAFVYKREA